MTSRDPSGGMPTRARRSPTGGTAPPADPVRERRRRALEEPLDVRPRSGGACPEFEVDNPVHGTRYHVFLPELPGRDGALCDCTDFGRRGVGTCKHIEAVLLWVPEHPGGGEARPAPFRPDTIWAAIDAARAAQRAAGPLDPATLRIPGEILLARPPRSSVARGEPAGPGRSPSA